MLPSYHIRVFGTFINGIYMISVTDNGPGFRAEAIELIMSKIQEIDETGLLPSLEIKGMGLLNIYLRYKILYGANVIFQLNNNEGGGARITIGGRYP